MILGGNEQESAYGSPSNNWYHNNEFRSKMREFGIFTNKKGYHIKVADLFVAVLMNTLGWLLLDQVPVSAGEVVAWSLFHPSNLICFILIAALCVVLFSPHYRWRVLATFLFAAIQLFGMMVIWSVPGAVIGF